MLRTNFALALAISSRAFLPTTALAGPAPSSPLDSFPVRIDYVTNNAPFVVFDVAPRTLSLGSAIRSFKDVTLNFVATELLPKVDVFTYVSAPGGATQEVPARIGCGSKDPGHHSCTIPAREALLLLNGGDGVFGMRIEAEGIEGDRSTVRVTLPVKAGGARPAAPAVRSRLGLTLLSAPADVFSEGDGYKAVGRGHGESSPSDGIF